MKLGITNGEDTVGSFLENAVICRKIPRLGAEKFMSVTLHIVNILKNMH